MNASATPTLTHQQEVERSLSLLMDQIIVLDGLHREHRNLPPHPGPRTIQQLADEYGWDRQRTPAERFAMDIKYDPVRETLCYGVRRLGKRLHEIGGMAAMREACDRQEDAPNGYYRIGIIDKRWDGIGDWVA